MTPATPPGHRRTALHRRLANQNAFGVVKFSVPAISTNSSAENIYKVISRDGEKTSTYQVRFV